MIEVSRINGRKFVLNCELIRTVEATPDTVLTLVSGERLMVKESVEDVIRLTVEYRRRVHAAAPAPSEREAATEGTA